MPVFFDASIYHVDFGLALVLDSSNPSEYFISLLPSRLAAKPVRRASHVNIGWSNSYRTPFIPSDGVGGRFGRWSADTVVVGVPCFVGGHTHSDPFVNNLPVLAR